MKFGIFFELQLPRPWEEGDELRLYQNALTQLETADQLGYDHAWVVEHHFLEEYSHSPAPESFLAAASQRTKKIRLGHGIFQLTTNHPARVAERVAVLDLLSNGRCEFGMGESASITELTPFGRDMETIAKKLRRFRSSHVDQVILLNQAGKNTHEHICESLELFGKEVMPEFQNDPEHDAWKKGVMSGAIQLEEIDTEAFKDRYGKLAVSVSPAPKVAAG